jgi:hypothetical protein
MCVIGLYLATAAIGISSQVYISLPITIWLDGSSWLTSYQKDELANIINPLASKVSRLHPIWLLVV